MRGGGGGWADEKEEEGEGEVVKRAHLYDEVKSVQGWER
jgi:hypothetical protein